VPVVNVKVLVLFVANLVLASRTCRPSGRSEALTARDVPVLEPRAGLGMNGLDEGLVQVKHEDRVLRAELILDHAVVGL
jgi:hypothetical protein